MADEDTTAATPPAMPFTQAIRDAEAQQAHDHPEITAPPFSQTDAGKLILDQEARTAEDFAAGRISTHDYDAFRQVSEERLESLKEHLGDAVGDIVEDVKAWAADTKEAFRTFEQEHPGVMEDLKGDNPTVANAAAAAQLGGDVLEPLVEVAIHDLHNVGDVAMGEVIGTAEALVEARAEVPGVTRDEMQSNDVRLDSATTQVRADAAKFDRGMDEAEGKVHEGFQQFHAQVDQVQEWAEQHPDAHVIEATTSDAPDVQQAVVHEAGTEA